MITVEKNQKCLITLSTRTKKKEHDQFDCQPLHTTTDHSSTLKLPTVSKSNTPQFVV